MNCFKLVDLFPYLTWDCPLHDRGYAATLGRIIISYIGKQEITLTAVSYVAVGSQEIIRNNKPAENSMFRYKTCSVSTNGSFYLIEDQLLRPFWCSIFTFQYYENNLRYISSKEINTLPAALDNDDTENDEGKHDKKENNYNKMMDQENISKYQKYMKVMKNRQWEEIPAFDGYWDSDYEDEEFHGLDKQIEIENMCVIDLNFKDESNNINVDDNNNDICDMDEEKSKSFNFELDADIGNDGKSDFCWRSPMKQIDNTAMIFSLNNNKTNVFIKYQGIREQFVMNHHVFLHSRVLDVWQCDKAVYSIIKLKLSKNRTQLQLIKTYFVKTKDNININNTNNNVITKNKIKNTKRLAATPRLKPKSKSNRKPKSKSKTKTKTTTPRSRIKSKSRTKAKGPKCNCKPVQKVELKLVTSNSSVNISTNKQNNPGFKSFDVKLPKICKNCNYFDAKSQTLFTVENTSTKNTKTKTKNAKSKKNQQKEKESQGIILRLIQRHNYNAINKRSKSKSKSKSTLELRESRTKRVRSKSPKISADRKVKFNDNSMKEGETIVNEIKPQSIFLNSLFNQSKCHFVFYHKQSKALILMLKLNQAYQNEYKENVNVNVNTNIHSDYINSGINNADGYSKWRQNAIMNNNGRLLVQLKINFKNKKLISSRIGNIIINENKCRIVAYDETRAMIIYDTLPDIVAQYEPVKKLRQIQSGTVKNDDQVCQYQKVRPLLAKPNGNFVYAREAKIHNYKMMRLNDLVDCWIDLPV